MATKNALLSLISQMVEEYTAKGTIAGDRLNYAQSLIEEAGFISSRRARLLLHAQRKGEHKNKIFKVEFIKRTTGELRVMRCRYNVKKHLKGGKLGYDPKEKDLSIVFDVDKEEYRAINLNELKNLHINGRSYIVY